MRSSRLAEDAVFSSRLAAAGEASSSSAADEIAINYIGGRSQGKHAFKRAEDSTIADFKKLLYAEFHGLEEEFGEEMALDEKSYTENHYLKTKAGKVLDSEEKTFKDYGFVCTAVPYDLSLVPRVEGGMPRGGSRTPRNSVADRDEQTNVLEGMMTAKGQMAAGIQDAVLTAIVSKVRDKSRGFGSKSGTEFLAGKVVGGDMVGSLSIDVLEHLAEALNDNRNPNSKIRTVSKVMFKEEFAVCLAKEAAVKNLTATTDGLLDLCAQYLLAGQYMGADGLWSWKTFEDEVKKTLKEAIYKAGLQVGRSEMVA
jgi:hypothetical protein